jgi:hypothetical protein
MVLSGENQNETDDCGADILKGGAALRARETNSQLKGVCTRITISLVRMTAPGTRPTTFGDARTWSAF